MATASAATSSSLLCSICIEEILPNANISKLNCNHEYHRDCLQSWIDRNQNTCPLDREKITSINDVATELAKEKKSHIHPIEVQNPSIEPRALYQRSYQVISNPSLYSDDPVVRQAARIQSIFLFRPPS